MRRASVKPGGGGGGGGYSDRYRRATVLPTTQGRTMSIAGGDGRVNRSRSMMRASVAAPEGGGRSNSARNSVMRGGDRRASTRPSLASIPTGMSIRADDSPSRRKPQGLKLSSVISKKLLATGADKVSVVEKGITEIDRVKELQAGTQILFISGNLLRSLSGAEQFANLRILSAASNYIAGFEQILCLKKLERLETLSLLNNLVTQLPFYRLHVVSMCPMLRSLDGKEVTRKEHELALSAMDREQRDLRVMYAQHCLVWKLRGACNKVAMLDEFHNIVATQGKVRQLPSVVTLEKFLVSSAELLVWYFTRSDVEAQIRKSVRRSRMLRMNSSTNDKDFDSVAGWEAAYVSVFNDQNIAVNHAFRQLEDMLIKSYKVDPHGIQDDSIIETFKELCLQLADKGVRGELLADWRPRVALSSPSNLPPQQLDPGTPYDMSVLSTASSAPQHDPRTDRQRHADAQHLRRMTTGAAHQGPLLSRPSASPAPSDDQANALNAYIFAPDMSPPTSECGRRPVRRSPSPTAHGSSGNERDRDADIVARVDNMLHPGTVPVTPLDTVEMIERSRELEKLHGLMTLAEMDITAEAKHAPPGAADAKRSSQASGVRSSIGVADELKLQQVNEALREKLVDFQTSHEKASKAAKQYKQQLQDSRQEAKDAAAKHEADTATLLAKQKTADARIKELEEQLATSADDKRRATVEFTSELDATRSILSKRGKEVERARRESDARYDDLKSAYDAQARELGLAQDTVAALRSETAYLNSKLAQYKQEIQTHRSLQRQRREPSVSNSSVQTSTDIGDAHDDDDDWGSVEDHRQRDMIQAMGDRALLRRALRRFRSSVEPLIRKRDGCSLLDDVMRIQQIRDVMKKWRHLARQDAFVNRGEERRRRRVLRNGLYKLYQFLEDGAGQGGGHGAGRGTASPPVAKKAARRGRVEDVFSPTPQPTSRQPKAYGDGGSSFRPVRRYSDSDAESDAERAPRARTRSPMPHEEAVTAAGRTQPPPRATARARAQAALDARDPATVVPAREAEAAAAQPVFKPRPSRRRHGEQQQRTASPSGKAYPADDDGRIRVVPSHDDGHGRVRTGGKYDKLRGRLCADPNQADCLSSSEEASDSDASDGACDEVTPRQQVRTRPLSQESTRHPALPGAAHLRLLAAQLRKARDHKVRDAAMRHWLQQYRKRVLLARLEDTARRRFAAATLRGAFSKWKSAGLRSLARYRVRQDKLLHEIEAQKERVSTLGLSNMRLVESLSEAIGKAATLEVEVESKATALQDMNQALNSCKATGKALRCRLQGVASANDEKQAKIKALTHEAMLDEEKITEFHTKQLLLESANARQMHELNTELEDAKTGLGKLYEQLRGTQAELDQAQETGVTATQTMMAVTSRLREQVSNQEAVIAELEMERRQQEEAQDAFQKDLVDAKRKIADEQAQRSAFIREQQEKMHTMRQQMQRSEVALSLQKSENRGQELEVKRLQHEVRLMHSREAGVGPGAGMASDPPSDTNLNIKLAATPPPSGKKRPREEAALDDMGVAAPQGVLAAVNIDDYVDTSGEVEELLKRARKAKEQLSLRESQLRRQGAELLMRAASPSRHSFNLTHTAEIKDGSDSS